MLDHGQQAARRGLAHRRGGGAEAGRHHALVGGLAAGRVPGGGGPHLAGRRVALAVALAEGNEHLHDRWQRGGAVRLVGQHAGEHRVGEERPRQHGRGRGDLSVVESDYFDRRAHARPLPCALLPDGPSEIAYRGARGRRQEWRGPAGGARGCLAGEHRGRGMPDRERPVLLARASVCLAGEQGGRGTRPGAHSSAFRSQAISASASVGRSARAGSESMWPTPEMGVQRTTVPTAPSCVANASARAGLASLSAVP